MAMINVLAAFPAVLMLSLIIFIPGKSFSEQTVPSVHQKEIKGVIGKMEECIISENKVICYVEFKSSNLSEKRIVLSTKESVMYDNKSVPYKASAVFLVNEEQTDKIEKK